MLHTHTVYISVCVLSYIYSRCMLSVCVLSAVDNPERMSVCVFLHTLEVCPYAHTAHTDSCVECKCV